VISTIRPVSMYYVVVLANKFDAPDILRATTLKSRKSPHKNDRFLTLIQLRQTRTRSGLLLESRPVSWAITANGPLARADIYGIITSP
jgi:hypothetical protein